MNRLSTEKRVRILFALCEGSSVNATARQTGTSKVTILKLLAEVGTAVLDFADFNVEFRSGIVGRRSRFDSGGNTEERRINADRTPKDECDYGDCLDGMPDCPDYTHAHVGSRVSN